jgi:anaerobic magnesium-protoporphyrin IX monomethyl ester cyclase
MKVLLLNPPSRRVAEKKDIPMYQHIGLGYLSSSVRSAGHETIVIDAKLERLGVRSVIEKIKEHSPDVIGITAMTHEIDIAADVADRCKNINPNGMIVLGGVHVSALPEDTLSRYRSIDVGVVGEGEITFPMVIDAFRTQKKDLSHISGVVFRGSRGDVIFSPNQWISDLDSLPDPDWRPFPNAKNYIIITSRGCPYSCAFCMQASGKKVRNRSSKRVIEEIERVIEERKPDRFLFYDETFTLNKARVHDICDMMIDRGLNRKIKWSATTRVDAVDEEILKKIKEAGCDHIEFGIESGNEEMLKRIKKGITKEQAEKAVGLAKKLDFHTEGAFILGHPEENINTAMETINFASKLNPDIVQLGIMVPYPGTEIREMALRGEGGYRILSEDWSEYNKQLGNAAELKDLSRSDLEKLQLVGYLRLFIYNRRYRDLLVFVLSFWREGFSFLRNSFRKRENSSKSKLNCLQVLRLIFSGNIK